MKPQSPDRPRKSKKSKFTSDSIDHFVRSWYLLYGIGFLLIIITAMFCLLLLPMIMSLAWQKTPCQIVKSEIAVEGEYDINRRSYNVLINYKYIFNGQSFEGGKYNFDEHGSMLSPIMENIIAKYPVGLKTICYVNPKDPTKAVLYRGAYLHLIFGFAPLGMLIVWVTMYLKFRKSNNL